MAQRVHGTQRFDHSVVGEFTLRHETPAFPADPGQTVCVYTAESGSASALALALLASWRAPDATRGEGMSRPPARQHSPPGET